MKKRLIPKVVRDLLVTISLYTYSMLTLPSSQEAMDTLGIYDILFAFPIILGFMYIMPWERTGKCCFDVLEKSIVKRKNYFPIAYRGKDRVYAYTSYVSIAAYPVIWIILIWVWVST